MGITAELHDLIASRASAPFLFIGSGFSRRYAGLEDWDGLLQRFCVSDRPYAYYKSSADKSTPLAARLLCEDFHNLWWTNDAYSEKRRLHSEQVVDRTSPLRLEICDYLSNVSSNAKVIDEYQHELDILARCDVDGIITTNWDCLIERIFPQYKVYVGQKELLFSNPLNLAEVYKIHGCCTEPSSLVLTDQDYADYNERNAYLASKLITIFVEHPVIFIGYSLTDPNIRALLKSIAACIGPENIIKLQNNLIFLDRNEKLTGPSIETAYLQFDSTQIPVKVVKTKDYGLAYSAIAMFERRMPARVLRFCKERIFEIVKDAKPEKNIAVVDFESIKDSDSVEVIFGLGVLNSLGEQGYSAITVDDLFEDLVLESKKYNSQKILEITLPNLPSRVKFVPVYKYLHNAGIRTSDQYISSGYLQDQFLRTKNGDFTTIQNPGNLWKFKAMSTREFLNKASDSEIVSLLPLLQKIDLDALGEYLAENFDDIMSSRYKYQYRRIMAFYDWLKYSLL